MTTRSMILLIAIMICGPAYATDSKSIDPSKTVNTVSKSVQAVFNKTNAFFQGDLEVTMAQDRKKYEKKKEYTVNALGQRVPKTTSAANK